MSDSDESSSAAAAPATRRGQRKAPPPRKLRQRGQPQVARGSQKSKASTAAARAAKAKRTVNSDSSSEGSEEEQESDSNNGGSDEESQESEPQQVLNNLDKVVLQSIQRIGILTFDQMKQLMFQAGKLIGKVLEPDNITLEFIQKRIDEINECINPFDMSIRKVVCELNETVFFMFHVTVESPIIKFQTYFTTFETEVFKKAMEMCLRKFSDFEVPYDNLLALKSVIKLESKSEKSIEEIIAKFVELKYLIMTSGNIELEDADCNLTLGIRAIRELEPLLHDLYKEIVGNCCLCKSVLLHGLKCVNCDFVFHRHCFKSFAEKSHQCPNGKCKKTLPAFEEMPFRIRLVDIDNDEDDDDDNGSEPDTEGNEVAAVAAADSDDSD